MGGLTSAMGLGIVLTLKDQVSAGLASIQQKLLAFKGVSKDMVQSFDEGARQMIGGFASIMAGFGAFNAIDRMFGGSVAVSRSFEMAMARVQAVSGATREEFEKLTSQAKEMGRTTKFTAMDAAGGQENLIRTGRSVADTLRMLPSALKLASAEGLTITEASDMISSSLRMFKMEAQEAPRVAAVLANASRSTAADSRSLYQALSYSGGTMGQTLGYSLEESVAMLGVLHNAVQRGSRAGTGLNQVMTELVNPKKLAKLEDLGIQTRSDSGEVLPAEMILAQLGNLKKTMGSRDFLGALSPILPTRARNAGNALIEALDEADNEYEKLLAKLRAEQTAADEMASIMDNTSQGAMFRLQSATEALRIAIGDQLRDAYDWVIGKMADFKSWLAQLIEQHPILTKAVAGLVSGLLALVGTLLIVTGAMAIFAGSLKVWSFAKIAMSAYFASVKAQALSAISTLWKFSTPIMAAITLAYALKKAWDANLFGVRDLVDTIATSFDFASRADSNGLVELDEATYERLQKAGTLDSVSKMTMVFYRLRELLSGIAEGIKAPFTEIKNIFTGIADAISPIIENSKILLGLLGFDVSSQVDSWRSLGEMIGYCLGLLLLSGIAWKAWGIATTIINGITWSVSGLFGLIVANPIAAAIIGIIALIALLYIYWDDFANWIKGLFADVGYALEGLLELWISPFEMFMGIITLDWQRFTDGLKMMFEGVSKVILGTLQFISDLLQPIIDGITWVLDKLDVFHGSDRDQTNLNPNVGESNYQQYRDKLLSRGYVLDDKDRVMQLPVELAALEGDDNYKRGIEARLSELRNIPQAPESPKSQIEAITPQAPQLPQVLEVAQASTQAPVVSQPLQLPENSQHGGQSAGIIIRHEQNKASMTGEANAQAAAQNPPKVNVENDFNVKITSSSSDVNIDGEKVGSITHKYQENHELRQGIFGGWGSVAGAYGGAE